LRVALLVLKAGVERPHDEIVAAVVRMVRKIAGGGQYTTPATIDIPAIRAEVGHALPGIG
jgi:hypothetical protein